MGRTTELMVGEPLSSGVCIHFLQLERFGSPCVLLRRELANRSPSATNTRERSHAQIVEAATHDRLMHVLQVFKVHTATD